MGAIWLPFLFGKRLDRANRIVYNMIMEQQQYRLHIDIPLGHDEAEAIATTIIIMDYVFGNFPGVPKVDLVNYRLGHDSDRQKSNYLMKDENGHVNNNKSRLTFSEFSE